MLFSSLHMFVFHFSFLASNFSVPFCADCVQEIDAQRVLGYALFKDGKNTKLSYPLENFHGDVAGRSFHNGRFIQRMRGKAASIPKYESFFLTIISRSIWNISFRNTANLVLV